MEIITTLQQAGAGWQVDFFQVLTYMGNQEFYLLLIPFLFLGMYCPSQVAAGWGLGLVMVALYVGLHRP